MYDDAFRGLVGLSYPTFVTISGKILNEIGPLFIQSNKDSQAW